jgi:hypothetical protein
MREAEWLTCNDPKKMLRGLQLWISERKRLLVACACCRRAWRLMPDRDARRLIVLAERFADGLVDYEVLEEAFLDWGDAPDADYDLVQPEQAAGGAVGELVTRSPLGALTLAAEARGRAAGLMAIRRVKDDEEWPDGESAGEFWFTSDKQQDRFCRAHEAAVKRERAVQAALIREVTGTPSRQPRPLPEVVLRWQDGVVVRLALAAYRKRRCPAGTLDPSLLGILADALLDAGCDDEELTQHLRSEGPHVRGCWAVDAILGKV